ncbi:MAG TPA: inner membrane protein YhjD [Mycobacteriales bacterium]|nr:inner membrane protein YhjD [Mycobacteriales bacterium]
MGIRDRLRQERARRPWLDHLARAGSDYKSKNGDHMAAAVTYFSFLALFPLILVAFAVLGLVLKHQPSLLTDIQKQVDKSAPAGLGGKNGLLHKAMASAVDHWRSVGIIGLLGALYAGLGWIGNLRTAIQEIWEHDTDKENFLMAKVRDLLALLGLGLAVVISLGLTAAGTGATTALVRLVNLDGVTGVSVVTRIIGIAIAVLADTVIFGWMFVRLPRSPLTMRAVFRGSLFAAVGFEILKVVGTYYIAQVGKSPAAGVFGSVIGLLVFINLVSRFLLFSTAWTASSPSIRALYKESGRTSKKALTSQAATQPQAAALAGRPARAAAAPNGAAIAAGLVGVGMVSGATLARVSRHSHRPRARPRR